MIARLRRWWHWRQWERRQIPVEPRVVDMNEQITMLEADPAPLADLLRQLDTGATSQHTEWIDELVYLEYETPEAFRAIMVMRDFNTVMTGVVAELERMNR